MNVYIKGNGLQQNSVMVPVHCSLMGGLVVDHEVRFHLLILLVATIQVGLGITGKHEKDINSLRTSTLMGDLNNVNESQNHLLQFF